MIFFFSINGFIAIFIFFLVVFSLREVFTFQKKKTGKYFFSPLVTAAAAGFVMLAMGIHGVNSYRALIMASIVLSLAADTMLMIEETDLTLYGIVYFLAAHVLYIGAFMDGYSFSAWNLAPALMLASLMFVMFKPLKPGAGSMFVPVMVYMAVISVMLFFAVARLNQGAEARTILPAIGSALFMISDIILAVDKFIRRIPHSSVWTWAFYGPAQVLIAWSCF